MQHHISLKAFNTFGIDVEADSFVEVQSADDMNHLIMQGYLKAPHLILGGGSNVLFTGNFEGLVICNKIKGIFVASEDDEHVYITAGGGEIWHDLVIYCVSNGWGGIENLSLIPGTVGAAPMQNIGAYGVELTHVFQELTAIDLRTGKSRVFLHADCDFGYRESVFKKEEKGNYFISSVTLRLKKYPNLNVSYGAIKDVLIARNIAEPSVKDVSDAVIYIRKSKLPDPAFLGNAGSFFKNPEVDRSFVEALQKEYPNMPAYPTSESMTKVPAGWLIEQCGWKGKRVGNVGAHKDQALVIVNYGGATGAETLTLAYDIRKSVMNKFGIEINPEVNII